MSEAPVQAKEETRTEKQERLRKEYEERLAIINDVDFKTKYEAQARELEAKLAEVRSKIALYDNIWGIEPKVPGTKMAEPKTKKKNSETGRKNLTLEEKILKVMTATGTGAGLTLKEIEEKTGIKKQTLYLMAREKGFDTIFEPTKNGREYYYSVRSAFENAKIEDIQAVFTSKGAAEPKKN